MSRLEIAGAAAWRANSSSPHFKIEFNKFPLSRARSRLTA